MEKQPPRRQYVRFAFYQMDPAWRRLPAERRSADTSEFIAAVEQFQGRMLLRSYTLVGLRGDADFLLWQVTEDLPILREFAARLNQTSLAPYLLLPHALLSMTRRSIYEIRDHAGDDSDRITILPGPSQYLFVYPFVKTRPWYVLTKTERQAMMDEHIKVGRRYPQVKINTTYSYGLDDQEFVVAFETDDPPAFLDLVAELRETEASLYTLRDTPMFTCEAVGLRAMLAAVGGVATKENTGVRGSNADVIHRTSTPHAPSANGNHHWHPVAPLSELVPGTNKLMYVEGEAVAVWNVDGQIYAINNRCTHARGSLCEGTLEGTTVTCPWHGGQFDLRSGAAVGGPARIPVATYATRITTEGIIEITMTHTPADDEA